MLGYFNNCLIFEGHNLRVNPCQLILNKSININCFNRPPIGLKLVNFYEIFGDESWF